MSIDQNEILQNHLYTALVYQNKQKVSDQF